MLGYFRSINDLGQVACQPDHRVGTASVLRHKPGLSYRPPVDCEKEPSLDVIVGIAGRAAPGKIGVKGEPV